ncbi:MAG: phosphoglycerate dehydrogenase, partial [Acidobacteriaceae bacterium]|nr:phosphoglycerate dehydrogenase [Acidobacteriaceae bacterium]
YLGTVLGHNGVNIANFALGRQESTKPSSQPLTAISIIETDEPVPDSLISQLFENKAVKFVRRVNLNRH